MIESLKIQSKFKPLLKLLFNEVKQVYFEPNFEQQLKSLTLTEAIALENKVALLDGNHLYYPYLDVDTENKGLILRVYKLNPVAGNNANANSSSLISESVSKHYTADEYFQQLKLISFWKFNYSLENSIANAPATEQGDASKASQVNDTELFKRYVADVKKDNYLKVNTATFITPKVNQSKEFSICGQYKDLALAGSNNWSGVFNFFNLTVENLGALFFQNNSLYQNDSKHDSYHWISNSYDWSQWNWICLSVSVAKSKVSVYVNDNLEVNIGMPYSIPDNEIKGNVGLINADFDNGESSLGDYLQSKVANFMVLAKYMTPMHAKLLYTLSKLV